MRLAPLAFGVAVLLGSFSPAPAQTPEPLVAQLQKPAAAPTTDALPALRQFRPAGLQTQAATYERDAKQGGQTDTRPIAVIRKEADAAAQRKDFETAAALWRQIALASGQDSAPWARVAMMYNQVKTDGNYGAQRDDAFGAAALALVRAKTRLEEAFALNVLSAVYEGRKEYRLAIDAAKAAVEAKDSPATAENYARLRVNYGFRFKDQKVNSDTASPRLCLSFSENLAAGKADYTPFVKVEGQQTPAISVEESQICIDGLRHGESYNVQLRDGLPSAAGERLARPVDIRAYVPDRAAQVRPLSRAYVLPRSGQQGLPVTTVNLSQVKLEIFRISDRNLINQFSEGDMAAPDRYSLMALKDSRAIPVWNGTMDVKNTLNQEVVTALPIEETVKTLQPGLYVLYAAPPSPKRSDDDGDDEGGATQWFLVSDLGLATFTGDDGLHGFVNSLASGKPVAKATVKLLNRANEVVGTKTTDDKGYVKFEPGLIRDSGPLAPAMVTAEIDGDFGFLNLARAPFDLSDRGVGGRATPGPLDAFITPERGIYRSGETVNLTLLVRDGKGVAVDGLPVTVIIQRPDGVEYRRIVSQDSGAGGRVISVPIVSSAPTGTWTASVKTDPKKPDIGTVQFMVDDFVPDRIAFDIRNVPETLRQSDMLKVQVDAKFLFGGPGSDLAVEGDISVKPTNTLPGFDFYVFGEAVESEAGNRLDIDSGTVTDEAGKATLELALPEPPEANKPLAGEMSLRVAESGGRAVEKQAKFTVLPASSLIGVKPSFKDERSGENEDVSFDLIMLGPDGKTRQAQRLKWQLVKLETRWQWSRSGGIWQSETTEISTRVADGIAEVGTQETGKITARVGWGRYRLDVFTEASSGPKTQFAFEAGWGGGATADTPDVLDISLGRKTYKTGENLTVSVKPRFAGTATLMVVGDGLLAQTSANIGPEGGTLSLPVAKDWGVGAYAMVIHRRPLDVNAGRMPGRSIGLGWFDIDRSERQLAVSFGEALPQKMSPRSKLTVPVKVEGIAAGQQAYVTLAAVDVGILNLTGFKPPKPEEQYLGQRQLSGGLHDLYGQLIDGMQGMRGAVRSGGDEGQTKRAGSPPAQDPVSLFSGLVTLDASGKASISFDVPDFNGTLRLMAVAWSKDKTGSASADVIVRDPVVVMATLPRAMRAKDNATIGLDVRNVEGPEGVYRVSLSTTGAAAVQPATREVTLKPGEGKPLSIPLEASGSGPATVTVAVSGPNGLQFASDYRLLIRPAYTPITRRTLMPLAAGGSVTLSRDLIADLVPADSEAAVSVSPSASFDVAGLLMSLDRYPYGCSEQIVSRAMPLLYLSELSTRPTDAAQQGALDERMREAIDKLLSRQDRNGGFGLWSANTETENHWLNAHITDFLIRAEAKGHAVPAVALRMSLDRMKGQTSGNDSFGNNGGQDIAYEHYVLAKAGYGNIGDLRWLADARLNDIKTPLARAQLAAALAIMGDRTRAERVMNAALMQLGAGTVEMSGRIDYGSRLRDAAAIMSLAGEAKLPPAMISMARQVAEQARQNQRYTSTQEKQWLVLAARALAEEARSITLDVGGASHQGALSRTLQGEALAQGLTIRNSGSQPLHAAVTVSGTPVQAEPAVSHDFTIERSYHSFDGRKVDITKVPRGTRLVVVLRMTDLGRKAGDIVVNDPLPAGFEIDNPALVATAENSRFSWLPAESLQPIHTEFRDDRFTAAYTRSTADKPDFTASYVVRAVTLGRFVQSGAVVEDMYRPDRFARTGAAVVEVTAK